MNRRRVIVNSLLGLGLLGVTVAGGISLLTPRSDPNADLPTTKVVRGTLDATVTASGNVESGVTASLQMPGTGGVVTKVYVKAGRKVTVGDKLVAVDDTAAQQQLDSALATLASAEAGLDSATQGRTSAERKSDSASIASARQSLKNAQKALDAARETYEQDKSQQGQAVSSAQDKVDSVEAEQTQDEADLAAAQQELAACTGACDPAPINTRIADLQAQLVTDASDLTSAKASLTAAQQSQDQALLQDRHNVTTQKGLRDSAKKSLAAQKATVAVSQQSPKSGTVGQAKAQVASAKVTVEQARTAVEDTVLRAPFDGTVSTVSAAVGQSSSTAGSSDSTSSTSSSGLVTVVDPTGKSVSASIAEADVTAVKVGQPVTITLPASGAELKGKVVSVDPQSTVTNNVVLYQTRVSLEAPPSGVRVGQTASISITTASSADVLYVPTSAIATDGTQSYVMRVADGKRAKVEVTTGMTGTTGTEIASGLTEGDVVLLSNTGETESTTLPGAGASSSR